MTLFQYLNIPDEFNLLTDTLYAYNNNLVLLNKNILIDNIQTKLISKELSLSEQLKIPITINPYIDIPPQQQIPHLIITDKNNYLIYTEHILQQPNTLYATPPDNQNQQHILKLKGLCLQWKHHQPQHRYPFNNITRKLLLQDAFNTQLPDGSPYNQLIQAEIIDTINPNITSN